MTKEEKAKAYDEALEKAKSMIDDLRKGEDILAVSDLESMFPELKESEDERIRKAILGLVFLDGIEPILTKCSVKRSDILSYLGKQKEQKPTEWSEEDEKMRINILNALTPQLVYSVGKGTYTGTSTYKYDEEIKWLKSLHPSWKPSEEQMAELNKVRTLNPGLDALYQQLKNM